MNKNINVCYCLNLIKNGSKRKHLIKIMLLNVVVKNRYNVNFYAL